MSISTGAPAAFARSLGQNDITKGTAVATMPTAPTVAVAPTRKRRRRSRCIASTRVSLGTSVAMLGFAFFEVAPRGPAAKLADYTGIARSLGSGDHRRR